MSNRFLSVLILIGVFGFGYLFYQFEIKPDKIKKQKEEEIELQKQQEINKIKEATLNRIEDKNIELTNKDNIENKIDLLKQKNHSFLNFEFDNLGTFYFRELEEKLGLYFDGRKLGEYDKIEKKYLDIKNIIGNNDYFYLKIGTNKYLYNLNTNSSQKLDLEVDIEYIKSGNIPQEFLFKTKVGTFLYLLSNNNFNYFNFFEDFVYHNDGYLGIIKKNDDRRLKNLSIEKNNDNLIIYYNPQTKQKNIIYKTDLDLTKIYKLDGKIFFENINGEKYELENINK